jgi:hypothetical protein
MNKNTSQTSFRIDFKILSILLLIAVAPLLAGSWWLFSSFQDTYLDMVGSNLNQAADMTFGAINSHFQNQIIEIAGLAETPTLRDAVNKGNLELERDTEAVRKAIPKMEAAWPSLKASDPRLRAIMENPASRFLARYVEVNGSYREILVTDFVGRTVASSRKTARYYHAPSPWWKEVYGDGIQGNVYVSDATRDRNTNTLVMEIAQPIVEASSGIMGEIKVLTGIQTIHSIIGSFRAAPGATAVLMRAKGEVISAPGYNPFEWKTYPPTLDILNAREKGRSYFVSATSPRAVFGLAQTDFKQLYPNLNWILTTTSRVRDVLGPLDRLRKYFVYLVVAVIVATLVAALLLSREETRPIVEQDAHLETL